MAGVVMPAAEIVSVHAAAERAVYPVPEFIGHGHRVERPRWIAPTLSIRAFEAIAFERGLPKTIRLDNGSALLGATALKRDHYI
jgi:hypothetical protein